MKLVTFQQDGQLRLGALREAKATEYVTDLNRAQPSLPDNMLEFLRGGDHTRALATKVLASTTPEQGIVRSDVQLKAPVPQPGKILCIGLNYRDHAAESNQALPEYPVIFSKYANTVIGPGETIQVPSATQKPDYEVELGVVIGKRAKNISEDDALNYVAGYLPLNDVSARDYQMRTSQWTIGKTFDTFAPMGPALVTTDEVTDPHNLDVKLSIGGEVLQSSNTRNLIFSVNYLIAYITAVMTLEPGDVIATGTPSGVGAARKPPRWLRTGDIVRIEIERLGVLENPVAVQS